MEKTPEQDPAQPVELAGVAGKILLASASPRRRAMLAGAGVPLVIQPVDLDESQHEGEAPLDYVRRLAVAKARAGWRRRGEGGPSWSLGSDTIVVLDGGLLHKPESVEEATKTLQALSGRTHHVVTAWGIVGPEGEVARAGHVKTAVTFKTLEAAQIETYVATGEPMDKAGAYGIQGKAGDFVQTIDGSYAAIVGLPLAEVLADLEAVGAVRFAGGDIGRQWAVIQGRVRAAAEGVGRDPEDVTVVAVSKRQPEAKVKAALSLGIDHLGENYVQAWRERVERLGDGPTWHFIGRLQRNKAKYLGAHVGYVHAIDDLRVAEALGKSAQSAGRVLPVMVQVNLSGEASKGGVTEAALPALLSEIEGCTGVAAVGLMTMPAPGDLAATRRAFRRLRALRTEHQQRWPDLTHLSMGMSGDFDVAIAEGATFVRVGSLLFGQRAG